MVLLSAILLRRAIGARNVVKTPLHIKGMMKGKNPITRTSQYLEEGIVFRDCVKVVTIHYGDYNKGGLE